MIYVQNVPSVSTDPNYTNGCPYSVDGRAHPLGLPISNDITTYGCRNGDAFIEGTLKGQLTIAADNNIDVTWHLSYNGGTGGTDLLGSGREQLHRGVAPGAMHLRLELHVQPQRQLPRRDRTQRNVLEPDHPGRDPLGQPQLPRAELQHRRPPRDTAASPAPSASATAAPVGTGSGGSVSTGFAKDYIYDQRLKYQSPPKFLDPVASAWSIAVWKEVVVPSGM